jgi:hypothetical protein
MWVVIVALGALFLPLSKIIPLYTSGVSAPEFIAGMVNYAYGRAD